MNCEDMTRIPQLNNVLNMKAGAAGMKNTIRWIYFADCLQCVKNEYHVEDYIHGGEFVVLTNPDVTEDKNKLMALITSMVDYGIAALGINEGQILPELIAYCNKEELPLFELPEKFPLVDLSQILCKRLVLEENNRNLEEQVFASILDAEHLNRDSVLEQAQFLGIDLTGSFCVVEFVFGKNRHDHVGLTLGITAACLPPGCIRTGDKKHYQYGVLILFGECACNAADWKRSCTCFDGQDK